MITIIHGDDINTSRKYFIDLKSKSADHVEFEGDKLNLTDLVQAIEGSSLFANDRKIFIENFFSKKKGKDSAEISNYLSSQSAADVCFWETKEISKRSLAIFKNPIINSFKLPQSLFLFLDSIKPSAGKHLISMFHNTIVSSEVELVFFMMVRQFRLLITLSDYTGNEIDEAKYLSPWQKSKLQKQAVFFNKEELRRIYKRLYEIDLRLKTGKLSADLTKTIDFFLLEI